MVRFKKSPPGQKVVVKKRPAKKPGRPKKKATSPIESLDIAIDSQKLDQYRRDIINRGRSRYWTPAVATPKRVLLISSLFVFFGATLFVLATAWLTYRQQSYSDFTYSASQVLPLPVARVDGQFISYRSYLTELRRYAHFFKEHQSLDFSASENKEQFEALKQRSLDYVINQVYIKRLAKQKNIQVSRAEVEAEFELLREQNKLGRNEAETAATLKNFFDITVEQYLVWVEDKLLRDKVVAAFDESEARQRASAVLAKLQDPAADFSQIATLESDDSTTKESGGRYNTWIDPEKQQEDLRLLKVIFATEVGEISQPVETSGQIEIIKVLAENDQGWRQIARISFHFNPTETALLAQEREKKPPIIYLSGNFENNLEE